jgi:IS5 family transposase
MKQLSFTDVEQLGARKKTKKQAFLEEMESLVPWTKWIGVIEPYYYKNTVGRKPIGIEKMLRMYLVSCWFNLSDPQAEDFLIENYIARKFVGIDLAAEQIPDETSLCLFRRLLTENCLQEQFFEEQQTLFKQKGIILEEGRIVDATIIHAPSSTKNKKKERDPEARQTKKGNTWYFGYKSHISVDTKSKLVTKHITTAANVHDSTMANSLITENTKHIYGDSGYLGIGNREDAKKSAEYHINMRPSMIRKLGGSQKEIERQKSQIRAFVEMPFLKVKQHFRFRKTRYKGQKKLHALMSMLYTLGNILTLRQYAMGGV